MTIMNNFNTCGIQQAGKIRKLAVDLLEILQALCFSSHHCPANVKSTFFV